MLFLIKAKHLRCVWILNDFIPCLPPTWLPRFQTLGSPGLAVLCLEPPSPSPVLPADSSSALCKAFPFPCAPPAVRLFSQEDSVSASVTALPALYCALSPHWAVYPARSRCTGNTCGSNVEKDRMHVWQKKAQSSLKPKQTQALLPSVKV